MQCQILALFCAATSLARTDEISRDKRSKISTPQTQEGLWKDYEQTLTFTLPAMGASIWKIKRRLKTAKKKEQQAVDYNFLDFKNGCTCIGLETQEKWISYYFYKSLTSDLLSILTFTCLYKGVENEE